MTAELATLTDFIRYGASRFAGAGLTFGHSHDNAIDEASHLVLASLHLPPDIPPAYGAGRLTAGEREKLLALIERRVNERLPVAYLVGQTWFAGLQFNCDPRALVPRSPLAELIESGFAPWLTDRQIERALDLCTGSGCIGIAMARYNPSWRVDLVDISPDALDLARENITFQQVGDRVEVVKSDLLDGLHGRSYQLIVSNPPYVSQDEYTTLPAEYAHEPRMGLIAGRDGLDSCLRILAAAADFLTDDGLLIVEVGDSERALKILLPEVPFVWIDFQVGPMGVFVLTRRDLLTHRASIDRVQAARRRQ